MTDRGAPQSGLLVAGWVMLLLFPIGTVITGFVIAERHFMNGVLMAFLGTLAMLGYVWLGFTVLG